MYAIIKTGGKQYKVKTGDIIEVERLGEDAGKEVRFETLFLNQDGKLMIVEGSNAGKHFVTGEVLGAATGRKLNSIKYKPSHNQYRRFGHRQHYTKVKITNIGS